MDKQSELDGRLSNLERLVAILLQTDPRFDGYESITKQAVEFAKDLRNHPDGNIHPALVGESQLVRYLRAAFALVQHESARLSEAIYPYLMLTTLGLDAKDVPLTRVLPVRVYLSGTETAETDVEETTVWFLHEILEGIGFRPTDLRTVERGSWFFRAFSRSKDLLTHEQVVERLKKLEHAAEIAAIKRPQAEVDSKEASAVRDLLTGIREVPNAVIQVASLLIVKQTHPRHGERVVVRSLTTEQMMAIEKGDVSIRDIDALLKLICPDDQLELPTQVGEEPQAAS